MTQSFISQNSADTGLMESAGIRPKKNPTIEAGQILMSKVLLKILERKKAIINQYKASIRTRRGGLTTDQLLELHVILLSDRPIKNLEKEVFTLINLMSQPTN